MVTFSNTRSAQPPGRVSTITRKSGLRTDRVRRARLDRLTPPTQAATLIVRIGTPRHRGQLSATDHQRAAPDAIRYRVTPCRCGDPPGRPDLIDVPAGTGGDGSPPGSIHPAAETLPDRPPPVATSPQRWPSLRWQTRPRPRPDHQKPASRGP